MLHRTARVVSLKILGQYRLLVGFDDNIEREIDFEPVLAGELFGPLRDPALFRQVSIDVDVKTLVWPNGADFDPQTLHDWPDQIDVLKKQVESWAAVTV